MNTLRRHSFGLFLPMIVLAIVAVACNQSQTGTSPAENSAAPSPAASQPSKEPAVSGDISGNYSATGTNENGAGNYDADITVTKRDDVYQFSWTSGTNKYDGVGVKIDNTVAVAFSEGTDGKGCGVVLYKVGSDGSLDGKAGYWGVNAQETEKGTRKSGNGFEGSYAVTGKNSTGSPYEGTLDVKKDGGGYAFTWKAPETVNGFGMLNGDMAAAGLGGDKCGFVMYQIKAGGTLDGKWGGQGSKSFGTEVAKKK